VGKKSVSTSTGANTALPFTHQPAVSQKVKAGVIETVRRSSPTDEEKFEQTANSNDLIAVYRRIVAPFGLRDNDAADVMTAYLVRHRKKGLMAASSWPAVSEKIA
jgi:hypothetical protein